MTIKQEIPPYNLKFVRETSKTEIMNVKRLFGTVLTILGIVGLIYAAYNFANAMGTRNAIIFGIVGLIFFIAGIGLVKRTKDDSGEE